MSQVKEKVREFAGGLKDILTGGGDVTSQQIVSDMGKIDDNLAMKTEIKRPMEVTLVDLMAVRCEDVGYSKTARLLKAFNLWYRVNMVSFKRKGREEAFEAFRSLWLMENIMKNKDNDVFGAGRK